MKKESSEKLIAVLREFADHSTKIKNPGEELSEVKVRNLPKKKLRVMMVKMIRELTRRMDAQSEKLEVFNKELENIKNNQTDQKYNN